MSMWNEITVFDHGVRGPSRWVKVRVRRERGLVSWVPWSVYPWKAWWKHLKRHALSGFPLPDRSWAGWRIEVKMIEIVIYIRPVLLSWLKPNRSRKNNVENTLIYNLSRISCFLSICICLYINKIVIKKSIFLNQAEQEQKPVLFEAIEASSCLSPFHFVRQSREAIKKAKGTVTRKVMPNGKEIRTRKTKPIKMFN